MRHLLLFITNDNKENRMRKRLGALRSEIGCRTIVAGQRRTKPGRNAEQIESRIFKAAGIFRVNIQISNSDLRARNGTIATWTTRCSSSQRCLPSNFQPALDHCRAWTSNTTSYRYHRSLSDTSHRDLWTLRLLINADDAFQENVSFAKPLRSSH